MHTVFLPPVVMLLIIAVMAVLNQYLPVIRLWEMHFCWIGIPLVVLGLGMAQWHVHLFRKIGTNVNTFKEPGILTREGLYRFSRNPVYLGFMVMLAGVWMILGSVSPLVGLAAFWLLANYWYIPFEERAMLSKFGDEYIAYRKSVRRWL